MLMSETAECVANSVDPARSMESDLGVHSQLAFYMFITGR